MKKYIQIRRSPWGDWQWSMNGTTVAGKTAWDAAGKLRAYLGTKGKKIKTFEANGSLFEVTYE